MICATFLCSNICYTSLKHLLKNVSIYCLQKSISYTCKMDFVIPITNEETEVQGFKCLAEGHAATSINRVRF